MESGTKSNHNFLEKNSLSGKISEWGELWTIFQRILKQITIIIITRIMSDILVEHLRSRELTYEQHILLHQIHSTRKMKLFYLNTLAVVKTDSDNNLFINNYCITLRHNIAHARQRYKTSLHKPQSSTTLLKIKYQIKISAQSLVFLNKKLRFFNDM